MCKAHFAQNCGQSSGSSSEAHLRTSRMYRFHSSAYWPNWPMAEAKSAWDGPMMKPATNETGQVPAAGAVNPVLPIPNSLRKLAAANG